MASASLFDTAQSPTSDESSAENNTNPGTHESCGPEHPRLSELRRQARLDAEHKHKSVHSRKLRKDNDKRGRISKSRRQTSNIRSAEICRAAKGIYIESLEHGIRQEDEFIHKMWKEVLDQVTENARVFQRITRLEELYNAKEAKKLWTRIDHVENAVPDEVVNDFFLASASGNVDVPSQWDHRRDGCLNAYDGDIELCGWDEDELMDFKEAPVTPPPPPTVKLDIPVTPKKEKQFAIHYNVEKILLSPVTIADDEQEPEEELFGLTL